MGEEGGLRCDDEFQVMFQVCYNQRWYCVRICGNDR